MNKQTQIQYYKLTSREVFVEVNKSIRVRNVKSDRWTQGIPAIWNPGGGKKFYNLGKQKKTWLSGHKPYIAMKLPLCKVTDFSQLCVCVGDPQDVWNHVPVKAVDRN